MAVRDILLISLHIVALVVTDPCLGFPCWALIRVVENFR